MNIQQKLDICAAVVGAPIRLQQGPNGEQIAYIPCPGAAFHTKPSSPRDCWLIMDEDGATPHIHCFHQSCLPARDDCWLRMRDAIRHANMPHIQSPRPPQPPKKTSPIGQKPAKAVYHPEWAATIASRCPIIPGIRWLSNLSPIPIPEDPLAWPSLLLENLYTHGDKILIFTRFASQGQYLYTVGQGPTALSSAPGAGAPPFRGWPRNTPQGAWYLTAPITGAWIKQPAPSLDPTIPASIKHTRRSSANCTRYPYLVIESDNTAPATWLKILIQMQYPIAAIYTSGGKSIHTIISIAALDDAQQGIVPTNPETFRQRTATLKQHLIALGADPAAIRPVQLSRLPGFVRGEKLSTRGNGALQRLLYLNPHPTMYTPLLCQSCQHWSPKNQPWPNSPCRNCHTHAHYIASNNRKPT